jgi:hypothetical protein
MAVNKNASPGEMMPEVTFSTFVLSLASSALVQMGEVPNPETGATEANTLLARSTIDILTMLEEKTSHGLEPDEARLLRDVLYELRMKFVVRHP